MKFVEVLLVKLRFSPILLLIVVSAQAQLDSVVAQITNSTRESFVTGISGDGRFVVFESTGNIATVNPRNSDGNREIFLFDYAQRQIFQITNTKSLLNDPARDPSFDNIKVEIVNQRPVISNDGRWIAFSSNATCSYPGNPTASPPIPPIDPTATTNPGNFDPNTTDTSFPCNITLGSNVTNNLVNDGNTEIWLYQIPLVPPADLSSGDEVPFVDLSAGTFIRVTNTLPSRLPQPGTSSTAAVIADDNRDVSINDNGNVIAFISNRDLVPCPTTPSPTCGNAYPDFDNPEVYVYVHSVNTISQVTATPRGNILAPIYNVNPNISGNGLRVFFLSNANNPIVGMSGGNNSDNSDEIFYADLDPNGNPTGTKRQVTQTSRTQTNDFVNILSYGKRVSRDGRFIAFESFADLTNENNGNNYNSSAVFVFDATASANPFRRIGPRADADPGASEGDVLRFPGFTDYDSNGTPATVVLTTRLNITPSGTIPSNPQDGLNPAPERPPQIYAYQLNQPPSSARFTRVSKFPASSVIASTQAYASNSFRRMAFSLAQSELGTGNFDLVTEGYYLLTPFVETTAAANFNFATGASRLAVSPSPVPTPSPTSSPTPTPSPTTSPTPTPTPITPPAVQGISPGMLAIVSLDSGFIRPIPNKTAVGSISRSPQLPIELAGVTMTIGGATVGLKSISRREIVFVVPLGLSTGSSDSASYPFVINVRGVVYKGTVTIVPFRPDVFTNLPSPGPGGRAKIQNVTNRVPTTEPFTTTTIKIKGGRRVPTVLRIYVTGVANIDIRSLLLVRIGSVTIPVSISSSNPRTIEPGIQVIDFELPSSLAGAGDQPVVVSVTFSGREYSSRLDDTAPKTRIL
ncbi:MAG: hypothetical protein N2Z23_02050 [Pyrinomonadaceae bacterium]|nr:hypothetical protein [Pyrinomonadaceae bacterium]MCX7639212.1 hypothetical protein [Pyrinomonadaceae bacterium]MDW8303566.1 hypothetical protein [Acidobacteriota bacterium]